jgi:hypothetical protein
MPDQGRFASAEKARDDRHGNFAEGRHRTTRMITESAAAKGLPKPGLSWLIISSEPPRRRSLGFSASWQVSWLTDQHRTRPSQSQKDQWLLRPTSRLQLRGQLRIIQKGQRLFWPHSLFTFEKRTITVEL